MSDSRRQRRKDRGEVAERGGLLEDAVAVQGLGFVGYPDERLGDVFEMVAGVDAARQGETQQLVSSGYIWCIALSAAEAERPHLGRAHAGLDLQELDALLADPDGNRVACVVITITNNLGGGQPVSMAHLRDVRDRCDLFGLPLLLDASRFAENAYLVSVREPGQGSRPPRQIAEDAFRLADGTWASLKKDGLANIGGMIGLRDTDLAQRCQELLIVTEEYSTYGGLAGRDIL